MVRQTLLMLCLALALFAVPAHATHWQTFNFDADCDGWLLDAKIPVASFDPEGAHIAYDVRLLKEGAIVEQQVGEIFVPFTPDLPTIVLEGGMWSEELCGDYTVEADFELLVDYVSDVFRHGTAAFYCECDTPPPGDETCHFTPGYWKNHPEDWPVLELALGGVSYTQDELLEIMDTPVKGDATIILAYHLIASKLNVLSGADDEIDVDITAGDEFLMDSPLFSKPGKPYRHMGLDIKDLLADYNEMGCQEGWINPFELNTFYQEIDETFVEEEESSWGSIKARF